MKTTEIHSISGTRLCFLISNAYSLLRFKYRGVPLWAMVSDLTGYGSTISAEICRQVGFQPEHICGAKNLSKLKS